MEKGSIDRSYMFSEERLTPVEGQVVNSSQLKLGEKYRFFLEGKQTSIFEVTSLPHPLYGFHGSFIDYKVELGGEVHKGTLGLAEVGIEPYESGHWNTVNRLEPINPEVLDCKTVSIEEALKKKRETL